jgi:sugar phosphate isomerase/epimerase
VAAAAWASPAAVSAQAPAGKPHLRSALCAYSFRDELGKGTMTYEDLIRLAADAGAEGLDLTTYWLRDYPNPPADYLLNLRRLAYGSALDIYSIGIRSNLCRSAPEEQEAEAGRLKPWLDVAERLGARHIRVFGGTPPRNSGATEDQAVAWISATLKKCADLSAARGILLGVEDDDALSLNADLLVKMVRGADSPWVGINLDVGNFRQNGYAQVATCLPYAVNMHLKTFMAVDGRPQPLDWDRLFSLVAPAYRGYIALEYEANDPPRQAVPEIIAKLNAAIRKYAPAPG